MSLGYWPRGYWQLAPPLSLARADAEFLLQARVGPLLVAAGMDGTTVDGTNVNMNGPIGRAIRALDHTVNDPTLVTSADVAAVTVAETEEFLDTATFYLLKDILTHLDDVDIAVGPRSEKLSQLAEQVERRAEVLGESLGIGLVTPKAGYLMFDLAEHN